VTTNEMRAEEFRNRIAAALGYGRDQSSPAHLGGRELALALTKLDEALMWAERIKPGTVGD